MKQNNFFTFLLSAAIALLVFSCNQQQEKNATTDTKNNSDASVNQKLLKPEDKTILVGNWIRTDAEYKIQISEINDDGKMKAGYFNPSSINVSQAQVMSNGGILEIFIELRDQNYPGSKYNLIYIKERDVLSGEYYQAVERNTYKVEFARVK